ncbi:MAG: hypothetical protein ABII21_00690 [bacterium]
MTKPKRYLPFPLFLLTLLVVGGTLWYVIKNFAPLVTPLSINEVNPTGIVHLEASPAPVSLYTNNSTTLDLNAIFDSDSIHLTAVSLNLTYLPGSLLIGFTSTDYLPITLSAATEATGSYMISVGVSPSSGGQTNWGTVGRLTIKALSPGLHVINFGTGTLASATEWPDNVLKSVSPLEINVYNPGDANHDKIIDLFDYNFLVSDYGRSDMPRSDFDKSGKVDLFDYNLLVANYGKISQ